MATEKVYEVPTDNGVLKMNRDYKERKASGQIGYITVNIQFNQHEVKNICDALKIDVFDKATVENAMYKNVVGKDREESDSLKAEMKPHVEKISKALETGSVNAENFEERLTAYADSSKLDDRQTAYLKRTFKTAKADTTKTEKKEEIEF